MHFFVFLLSVSALIVQGNAQYLRYYSDGLYQHPSYYPDTDVIQSPNLIPDGRLFWNLLGRTTTSTTTTTCTVFTAVACAGRRKRFLTSDDDPIEASPVNKSVQYLNCRSFSSTKIYFDWFAEQDWGHTGRRNGTVHQEGSQSETAIATLARLFWLRSARVHVWLSFLPCC